MRIFIWGLLLSSLVGTSFSQSNSNELNFDGINDYVVLDNLANDLAGSSNFTIEFWITTDFNNNLGAPAYIFAINPANGGPDNKFGIFLGNATNPQDGHITFYDVVSPPYYLVSPTVVGDNTCHHIAYVRTGSSGEGFVDGVSIGNLAAGAAVSLTDRFSLGQEWDGLVTSGFYNGNIDELRIWNLARTQLEIQNNMNSTLTGSEPGLVGYYKFDQGVSGGNNAGVTTLSDNTANSNDGSLNSFVLNNNTSNWITAECSLPPPVDTSSNELNFDGINDYVVLDNLANDLAGSSNFTIEFWITTDFNNNLGAPAYIFAINPANGGPDNKFGIFLGNATNPQDGHITFYDVVSPPYYLVSPTVVGDNTCHHIAYVRTGSSGEGFVDGVSIGNLAAGAAVSLTDRFSLGQEWDGLVTSGFYNGNIDELRIWNLARTQLEIQNNMNSTLTGSEPGLVGYYKFDQGVSGGNNAGVTTLNDNTANNNDGSLNSFTLNGLASNWVTQECPDPILPVDTANNELNFDGNDDYVVLDNLSNDLSGNANFTIEFWMKADFNNNLAGPSYMFAINPQNGFGDNRFGIFLGDGTNAQNGHLTIYEPGGSMNYLVSPMVIGDNNCHHIAYVRTGTGGEAFVDGVSIGTIPTGDSILSTDRISLAQEWDNLAASNFYEGDIDELRIWNVAKTQPQIVAGMGAALTGAESGLIGYYNFNQGVSGGSNAGIITLNDLTVNNNDGILNNFTLNGTTSNWVLGYCKETLSNEFFFNDMDIQIYPNPVAHIMNINTSLKDGQIKMIDLTGRVVYIGLLNGNTQIDLTMYPAGVYNIIFMNDAGVVCRKIVKS